jgi:hypothetical protein
MKREKRRKVPGMFDGGDVSTYALAAAAGVVTGIVDFLSADVVPAGTLILIFTFLLGIRLPRLAWLWALLVGGMVPLVWMVAGVSGDAMTHAYFSTGAADSCIIIGPAIVGAYLGAVTRHVLDHVRAARA